MNLINIVFMSRFYLIIDKDHQHPAPGHCLLIMDTISNLTITGQWTGQNNQQHDTIHDTNILRHNNIKKSIDALDKAACSKCDKLNLFVRKYYL